MSKAKNDQGKKSSENSNPLLTKKSLALALSPPRAPPYGSLHRNVLLGGGAPLLKDATWAQHYHVSDDRHYEKEEEAHSSIPHFTLRQRLLQRLKATHYDAPSHATTTGHPHLTSAPEWGNRMTRWLGLVLPLSWQNSFRDSGGFRSFCDFMVTATAPMVPLAAPSAVLQFVQKTLSFERIRYGPHKRQFIHLYTPATSAPPRRLLLFVHGGAWGSGLPWMYRLVANERFLEEQKWAIAIVGYRNYPDGHVAEQVADCVSATVRLKSRLFPDIPTTLVGHSSGAHIVLLMLVDRVLEQLAEKYELPSSPSTQLQDQKRLQQQQQPNLLGYADALNMVDSCVCLSAPLDISHHFDYEAARGVEEISPMKPVCGYTRENFRINSPAQRLQMALAHIHNNRTTAAKGPITNNDATNNTISTAAMDDVMPPIALIHGVDDETVPFTSTGEGARVLRSCGVTHCDEIYLADTGHQDTVMHLMLGGPALDATVEWIQNLDDKMKRTMIATDNDNHLHQPNNIRLVARSKL